MKFVRCQLFARKQKPYATNWVQFLLIPKFVATEQKAKTKMCVFC
jgi:hypothetical protein